MEEYTNAKDLQQRLNISYRESLKIIEEVQIEMKKKGYYIPSSKSKLALTRLVNKKLGIKDD